MTDLTPAEATRSFAALSHETRLDLFRLLARVGEMPAAALSGAVGIAPSALSFHLKDLHQAGLVESRRSGRQVLYSADYTALTALIAFLTDRCCEGRREHCLPASAPATPTLPIPRTPERMPEMSGATPNSDRVYTVLFLCTGNSARSQMAESILRREGSGRFQVFSAGSHPRGYVDPVVLTLLRRHNYPTDALRSKGWEEFAGPKAPELDFVFTVCDKAAGEVCPVWPGQPMSAHWGVPDPTVVQGNDAEQALLTADVYRMLTARITVLCALPLAALDRLTLQRKLDQIGQLPVVLPGEGDSHAA